MRLPDLLTSPAASARRSRPSVWLLAAALGVFLVHAANYLTFFVDDEGISFVYGAHLLDGRGLSYNNIEGRVEGYSNFLHVIIDAAIIGVTRVLGLPKLSVFFIGKALSILAAVATIALLFGILRRLRQLDAPGTSLALAVAALSGPLAVWSSSSLETVPFTCALTLLLFALAAGDDEEAPRWNRLAVISAGLVSLDRLDGPVFVAAAFGPWLLFSPPARRRMLFLKVCLPTLAVLLAYHGWRFAYFGYPLNMPAYSKVLYKMASNPLLVTRHPSTSYAWRFLNTYGIWGSAIVGIAVAAAAVRQRQLLRWVAAAVLMLAYVAQVGDWMFGFRFFVPIVPLIAVIAGWSLTVLLSSSSRLAWISAGVGIVWLAIGATQFAREYGETQYRKGWWRHPTFAAADYFVPYYEVYRMTAAHVHPGERTAYNQAGFVPFMLDLDNVDDLGICSEFFARLPTRDVIFTEVGRYAPLLERPVIQAQQAYLLRQDVRFVVIPGDLMRNSHSGHTPTNLLGGFYQLIAATGPAGLFARTSLDASAYQTDLRLFTENLAHPANAEAVESDGHPVDPAEVRQRYPFLFQEGGTISQDGVIEVVLAKHDTAVTGLYIDRIVARQPASLLLQLVSQSGAVLIERRVQMLPDAPQRITETLPYTVASSRFRLTVTGTSDAAPLAIEDLRVLGQSRELQSFVRKHVAQTATPGDQ